MSQHNPAWKHTEDGLAVRIGHREVVVPESIGDWFIGPAGVGTTADPGADFINLEGQIREVAAELVARLEEAEKLVASARATAVGVTGTWWSLPARHRRTRAQRDLRAAIEEHAAIVSTLEDVLARQDAVRQYVIALDCPGGVLAEAAAGWQRSPALPSSVVVFDDQASFLNADPRRAADLRWSHPPIGGCEFGKQWRRDGDDDEPGSQPLDRRGPWTLGHVNDEIYAIRRSSTKSQQVWLLGTGFATGEAHALLSELEPRMREPNSIIAAASTVHAARLRRTSAPHGAGPGPSIASDTSSVALDRIVQDNPVQAGRGAAP